MVLFNYSTKELTAKIVYYGPGLCGKTTNLQFVFENLPAHINKGKMLSLATKTDRTLFFDFLPIDLGTIRGMRTRLQLYTVPGQVFYNTTRKLVLKGADGLVFVADSQRKMIDANVESYRNLEQNLLEHSMKLSEMPHILQFNKRDLPDLASVEELNAALNKHNAPIYEAVATTGIGVQETLKAVTRLVLNSLKEKYGGSRRIHEREAAPAVAPVSAIAAAAPARPAAPPAPPPAAVTARASEDVLEVSPEGAAEAVLEIEEGAIEEAAPLEVEEAATPRAPMPRAARDEPVLSVAEDEPAPVVAESAEEDSPLEVEDSFEIDAEVPSAAAGAVEQPVFEEPPMADLPAEIPLDQPELDITEEPAVELEEEPAPSPAEDPLLEPLPIAAAETFEVETASVDPRGPVPGSYPGGLSQRTGFQVAPSPVSISAETRAVPVGAGLAAPLASREASFPIVVDVQGQAVHLLLTVTVRVEKS